MGGFIADETVVETRVSHRYRRFTVRPHQVVGEAADFERVKPWINGAHFQRVGY